MEDQVNLDHGYWQKDHSNGDVHGGSDDGQAQAGSCNLNLNSNFTHHEGQPRDHPNGVMKSVANEDVNQEVCQDGLNVGRLEGVVEGPPLITTVVEVERIAEQFEGRRMSNDAISYSSSTKIRRLN